MSQAQHPYAAFIHEVEKPARYLGGEYQSKVKDWESVALRICLAFPDIYDIGMSHLGTKILYSLLNGREDVACERAFSPWPDMEAQLRTRGLPVLSLESARPLADFDVVGFSLQYEMTYTNVLNLLDLSGLPLRAADRDDSHPLIIAGGPTSTHPEPMAPFIDAFLVGDAEEHLPKSLELLAKWRDEAVGRRQVLERLAALGGWYCPALYATKVDERSDLVVVDQAASEGPYPVERAHVEDLTPYPFPTDTPVPAAEAIFDRVSVEIARGCTEGCRFCQAGMIYRPVRERNPDQVVDAVMAAMDQGGYDEASLTSLSTADYSCVSPLIKKVMERMRARRASLSVSSLRAYGLDEDLLDEISSVKATGLTFAPEAGTQRMRDVINKNITDDQLLTTAHRVFSRGWSRMKLYFMIGLPTETDEDVAGIVKTAAMARNAGLKYHSRKRLSVTASASSHVPKPHTPFQWAAMDSMDDIEAKQKMLRDLGRQADISVKYHNHKVSYLEGIVARGDRRVGDLIERAFKLGCRFDGWDEHLNWDAWQQAIAETDDLEPSRYLGTLPVDGGLPWDHIDVGLAPKFLFKEYKRALKDRLSPPCGKPKGAHVHHTNLQDADADERKLICYHCGVACDLTQMREERKDFLRTLGAVAPAEPRAEDDLPAYKTVRRNKFGAALPPKRAEQGPAFPYRLAFTKLGTVSLTSQLDLTRVLPRVLRRAGLPLKYSQGFSPKPVLTYGPALPLGIASIAEVVDVASLEEVAVEELLERLNAVSDPGMVFLRGATLPKDAMSCARIGKLAEYAVAAPGSWTAEQLEAAIAVAQGEAPVLVDVKRKAGLRTIDIRDGLVGISVDKPRSWEAAIFGLPEDTPLLRWRVNLDEGAHVRATEFCQGVLPAAPRPASWVGFRSGLWGLRKGKVFDLMAPDDRWALEGHADLPVHEAAQAAR